jgi:hypothetical protein
MIVMPGFVDTHRHMWQGILRKVRMDGSLDDYRDVIERTFGARYTPDHVYAGDLFSAVGAIESGVTCILDWSHIHNPLGPHGRRSEGAARQRHACRFRLPQRPERNWTYWEIATSKFPGDIARLRRQYFSSDGPLQRHQKLPAEPALCKFVMEASRNVFLKLGTANVITPGRNPGLTGNPVSAPRRLPDPRSISGSNPGRR